MGMVSAMATEPNLAERGMAILMISSELPEVLGMADRLAVMHDGTIVGNLSRGEATQERVLSLALGHRCDLEHPRGSRRKQLAELALHRSNIAVAAGQPQAGPQVAGTAAQFLPGPA